MDTLTNTLRPASIVQVGDTVLTADYESCAVWLQVRHVKRCDTGNVRLYFDGFPDPSVLLGPDDDVAVA